MNYAKPDLVAHPPRSTRVRLGGFAHLPRLLDKARAVHAGKNGEYKYGSMVDRFFFEFTGISPDGFFCAAMTRKSDAEVLRWVMEHLKPGRTPSEIAQWSHWFEQQGPGSAERHAFLAKKLQANGPDRTDIHTWCDHLDLDDYVSFGGTS